MDIDNPRTKRLISDYAWMKNFKDASSIIDFTSTGDPPESYIVTFKGRSIKRRSEDIPPEITQLQRVEIRLGIDYPRSQPYLRWLTEIYHPNISASGAVCLGGYSTNWSPSLKLCDLCDMLWEMIRYANFDVDSPYNYKASQWAKTQTQFDFPLDQRPLRDKIAQTVGDQVITFSTKEPSKPSELPPKKVEVAPPSRTEGEILFIEESPGVKKTDSDGIEFIE